jgi:hypothetical protein
MMRGRRPKARAAKKLAGNPGKRALQPAADARCVAEAIERRDYWAAEFDAAKRRARKKPCVTHWAQVARASRELRAWNAEVARLQCDTGGGDDDKFAAFQRKHAKAP